MTLGIVVTPALPPETVTSASSLWKRSSKIFDATILGSLAGLVVLLPQGTEPGIDPPCSLWCLRASPTPAPEMLKYVWIPFVI